MAAAKGRLGASPTGKHGWAKGVDEHVNKCVDERVGVGTTGLGSSTYIYQPLHFTVHIFICEKGSADCGLLKDWGLAQ